MRDYGKIHTAYWTDDKIAGLSVPAKLMGAYLLTCPHSNAIGCFRLPVGYVSEDLQWDADSVHEALAELAAVGFICRDEASGWVLIRKFLDHNTIENANVGKACMRMVDAVPLTFPYFEQLLAGLQQHAARFPEGYLEGLKKRLPAKPPNGSANGSPNGSETVPKPFPKAFGNRMAIPEPEPNQESNADALGAVAPPVWRQTDLEDFTGPPASLKTRLFGDCLDWLALKTGKAPDRLRSTIGKWIRDYGEGAVLGAFLDAFRHDPFGPVAWIETALKTGGKHHDDRGSVRSYQQQPDIRREAILDALGDELGCAGIRPH
jgi:hypothetical protein